jgi:hypothetical protein
VVEGPRTDLGALIVFDDKSGQGLRPPKGRTWGRRGTTPVVKVTGGSNKRVSLAAFIAIKPGQHPRLIYRVNNSRRHGEDQYKEFTGAGYAPAPGRARQQLADPIVAVLDNLNSRHNGQAGRRPGLAEHLPALAVCARAQSRRAGVVAPEKAPGRQATHVVSFITPVLPYSGRLTSANCVSATELS